MFHPALFSSRFSVYRLTRNDALLNVPCSQFQRSNLESSQKLRGYASRFNKDMKILLGPSWMHDVCDGRVARRGQMGTAPFRTCPWFMTRKCQLLTRKRAGVVLHNCMQSGIIRLPHRYFDLSHAHCPTNGARVTVDEKTG